jgi:DNA-binding beta-propeller fold protein YncE
MSGYISRLYKTFLWVSVCLLVVSCTGPSKESVEQTEIQKVVWPKPPEQARIEFVRSIAKPEDLGITPGFWSRLASVFVGKKETRLIRPTAAVMTSEEVLFVADPGSKGVHRFDIQRKTHDMLLIDDKTTFRSPVSLTVDPENRVYVTDSALNHIYLLDNESDHAVLFNTSIPLDQPTGLAFDPTRKRLYVVNTRQHQVLAFDQQGRHLFSFGGRGAGAGQFNYPTQIWSDPATGGLWVTDSLNFRVQQFTADGKFITSLSRVGDATGNLPRPKGVATDSYGHVYVMDALHNNMQIFSQTGELLLYLGEQGRGVGQFWLPVGIYIDHDNRIYVADSFNNRVQVFRFLENKG